MDPSLTPILKQETYVRGGFTVVKIGDTEIEYNENFRYDFVLLIILLHIFCHLNFSLNYFYSYSQCPTDKFKPLTNYHYFSHKHHFQTSLAKTVID